MPVPVVESSGGFPYLGYGRGAGTLYILDAEAQLAGIPVKVAGHDPDIFYPAVRQVDRTVLLQYLVCTR